MDERGIRLKAIAKWGLTAIFICVAIVLISNISKAFINHEPDQLQVAVRFGASFQSIAAQLPGTSIASEERQVLYVPYGKVDEYKIMARQLPPVKEVDEIELDRPRISLEMYWFTVSHQFNNYLHGDFGSIRGPNGKWEVPITEAIKGMLARSLTYFIPGLLFAVFSALVLSLSAALSRGVGKVLDRIHTLFVALPDFFLITIMTLASIYFYKLTGTRLFHVAAFSDVVPFMIPFITIALTPGVLIYGTLRLAIERELSQDYVVTAKAKGLSSREILLAHVLRNIVQDLLAIMPKATNLALASLVIAEAFCDILGLGGIIVSPKLYGIDAMPSACFVLVAIAILFHAVYELLRRRFVVRVKEGM